MDPRVADILVNLGEATSKGNFGYAAWTFWPPKTHVYLHAPTAPATFVSASPAIRWSPWTTSVLT